MALRPRGVPFAHFPPEYVLGANAVQYRDEEIKKLVQLGASKKLAEEIADFAFKLQKAATKTRQRGGANNDNHNYENEENNAAPAANAPPPRLASRLINTMIEIARRVSNISSRAVHAVSPTWTFPETRAATTEAATTLRRKLAAARNAADKAGAAVIKNPMWTIGALITISNFYGLGPTADGALSSAANLVLKVSPSPYDFITSILAKSAISIETLGLVAKAGGVVATTSFTVYTYKLLGSMIKKVGGPLKDNIAKIGQAILRRRERVQTTLEEKIITYCNEVTDKIVGRIERDVPPVEAASVLADADEAGDAILANDPILSEEIDEIINSTFDDVSSVGKRGRSKTRTAKRKRSASRKNGGPATRTRSRKR